MSDATVADRVQCLLEAAEHGATMADGSEACALAVANCGAVTADVRALEARAELALKALGELVMVVDLDRDHPIEAATRRPAALNAARLALRAALTPAAGPEEETQEPPACQHRSTASVGSDAIHEEFECQDCHRSWVTVLKAPPPPAYTAEVQRIIEIIKSQPVAPDTVIGTRQEWMRASILARIKGKAPPEFVAPDPARPEGALEKAIALLEGISLEHLHGIEQYAQTGRPFTSDASKERVAINEATNLLHAAAADRDRLHADLERLKKLEAAQGLGADFTSLATDLATNCERSVWAQANKVQGWVNGVREELSEFEKATTSEHKAEELGDVLWNLLSAVIMFCNETAPAHSLKSIVINARAKLRQRKPWIFDGTSEEQLPKTPEEEHERYTKRKAELKADLVKNGNQHVEEGPPKDPVQTLTDGQISVLVRLRDHILGRAHYGPPGTSEERIRDWLTLQDIARASLEVDEADIKNRRYLVTLKLVEGSPAPYLMRLRIMAPNIDEAVRRAISEARERGHNPAGPGADHDVEEVLPTNSAPGAQWAEPDHAEKYRIRISDLEKERELLKAELRSANSNATQRGRGSNAEHERALNAEEELRKVKSREEEGCKLYDKLISDERVKVSNLKSQVEKLKEIIKEMHSAAVGEYRSPIRSLIEDVSMLRSRWKDAEATIEVLKKSLDLARLTWTQSDRPLPIIDDAISVAFPTRSGRHDLYAMATTLVSAKHMKYSIVDAFQWCFVTIDRMGKALDKIYNSTDAAREEVIKHYGVLHTHKQVFNELERLSHEAMPHGHLQPQNGIYVASKVRHASKWKELRKLGTPISASWLDESEPGQTASYSNLWTRIIQEVILAEAMVFYAEPGETMKGSLVELGAALAAGVPVYAVSIPEGSTFDQHPLVTKCETVEEAFRLATKVSSNPEAVLTQLRIKANEELERARFEVRFCSTSYHDGEMLYDTYMDRKKAAYDKVQLAHDKVDQQLRKMGRLT